MIEAGLSSNGYKDTPGFRFQNVTIEQGSTIVTAKIYLVQRRSGGGTPNIKWFGHDVDNAPKFSSGVMPHSVPKTTASTNFITSGTSFSTIEHDIKTIVQEIINRAGWVSGNSLAVMAIPQAYTGVQYEIRDREYSSGQAARLVIEAE